MASLLNGYGLSESAAEKRPVVLDDDVTELGDGRLKVTLRTPDASWARRLALGLGEDGRVLEPAALAAAVRADASAALAQYAP